MLLSDVVGGGGTFLSDFFYEDDDEVADEKAVDDEKRNVHTEPTPRNLLVQSKTQENDVNEKNRPYRQNHKIHVFTAEPCMFYFSCSGICIDIFLGFELFSLVTEHCEQVCIKHCEKIEINFNFINRFKQVERKF